MLTDFQNGLALMQGTSGQIAFASGLALVLLLAAATWVGWMNRRRPVTQRVVIQDPDHNTSRRG